MTCASLIVPYPFHVHIQPCENTGIEGIHIHIRSRIGWVCTSRVNVLWPGNTLSHCVTESPDLQHCYYTVIHVCQLTSFWNRNHISHGEHVFDLSITIYIFLCVSLQWAEHFVLHTRLARGVNAPLHWSPRLGERHMAKSVNMYSRMPTL